MRFARTVTVILSLWNTHASGFNREESVRRVPGTDSASPGSAIIESVLKLSAANTDKRILLLESDSIAGSIEEQYARVRNDARGGNLRSGVDEIWGVLTAILETENIIFTNRIDSAEADDRSLCSLNLLTGEFWRLCRDRIAR